MNTTGLALGDRRWTSDLILETWRQARTGEAGANGGPERAGDSGGGFDALRLEDPALPGPRDIDQIDLSLPLNRRASGPRITLSLPFYGGGMSYGSVSVQTMLGRAMAARELGTMTSTGEGGYPDELVPYGDRVITQIATGLFGVREETIMRARLVEFKYAQGAKPGLGGHLLGDKNTPSVAQMREAVPWTALFSPFPFHSVYSVEDHKKHLDWVRSIHPYVLVSVKVSTPVDVDMVAVGSYYAGANIIHLDGGYGGTGAAPDIAKKNIAQPIEYATVQVHDFLVKEGIRDEVVLMVSGGVRTPPMRSGGGPRRRRGGHRHGRARRRRLRPLRQLRTQQGLPERHRHDRPRSLLPVDGGMGQGQDRQYVLELGEAHEAASGSPGPQKHPGAPRPARPAHASFGTRPGK